jgi:hypothetical protein
MKEQEENTAIVFAFTDAELTNSCTKTAPKEVSQKTDKINTSEREN